MDGVKNWNCVCQHMGILQDMVMKWIVSPIYTYMGQEPELFELAMHFWYEWLLNNHKNVSYELCIEGIGHFYTLLQ